MANLTFNTRQGSGGGGGGSGTVTEVDTGTGLTGGPINTSGTISLADVDDAYMLANTSGDIGRPMPISLNDYLDYSFGNTVGALIFRENGDPGEWTLLNPGTEGQFLQTNGADESPSWEDVGGGGLDFNGVNAYVSQYFGDDSTGSGSFSNPVATIDAGYSLLQSATEPSAVYILDGANYTTNLVINNGNVSIFGPQANVAQAGSGDTLTCDFSGSNIQIVLNSLANFVSDSALRCTGNNSVSLSVNNLSGGDITQDTSGGTISILSQRLDCNLVCTGTGAISYITNEKTGTDTPGTGTITGIVADEGLAPIDADTVLSNIEGSSASPIGNTMSDILDAVFDDIQGDILYRGDTGWTFLASGDDGQILTTHGSGANPAWETPVTTETVITVVNVTSPVTELDFSSIGSYRTYLVEVSNVVCSTTCDVILQLDDGAGGWVTSSTYYSSSDFGDSGSNTGSWGSGPGSGINVFMDLHTITGLTAYSSFKLMGMNQSGVSPALTGTGFVPQSTAPLIWSNSIAGGLLNASNKTGFRLIPSTGNFTSGRVVVYGRDPI